MTGSRNEFHQLSATKDHVKFVRLSSLFLGAAQLAVCDVTQRLEP